MHHYDEAKMYTHLSGFCRGAGMPSSLRALGYMREKHGEQKRSDGQPYIVHPLWMASYAVALGLRDDDMIAVMILHDVCEDTGTMVEELPFNEQIRRGVRYMTYERLEGESREEAKHRYFYSLLECREALICKALDRFMNLSTMEGILSEEAVVKNVRETDELLLPVLRQGKEKWPELADLLFVLRANLRAVNDTLAAAHGLTLSGDGAEAP